MKLGIIVPQGWTGEYAGWEPRRAWRRSLAIALEAEALGVDSLWAFDHFHTTPDPTEEITFESFTLLTALVGATSRVKLGHLVLGAGYRNPALVAKMASCLDVISDGRFELGIGAGWKADEYRGYGYPFPPTRERLELLADALEIIRRMTDGGRATWSGRHARIDGAVNVPAPAPGRLPILVGGNGERVTWALAARFADELNLDAMAPGRLPGALATIARRCEEAGRDPATLRVSVHLWLSDREWLRATAEQDLSTEQLLARYTEAGVHRVMALVPGCAEDPAALARFVRAARSAGLELA